MCSYLRSICCNEDAYISLHIADESHQSTPQNQHGISSKSNVEILSAPLMILDCRFLGFFDAFSMIFPFKAHPAADGKSFHAPCSLRRINWPMTKRQICPSRGYICRKNSSSTGRRSVFFRRWPKNALIADETLPRNQVMVRRLAFDGVERRLTSW